MAAACVELDEQNRGVEQSPRDQVGGAFGASFSGLQQTRTRATPSSILAGIEGTRLEMYGDGGWVSRIF